MLPLGVLTCIICVLTAVLPSIRLSLLLVWGVGLIIGAHYVKRPQLLLVIVTGLSLLFFALSRNDFLIQLLLSLTIFVMAWCLSYRIQYQTVRRWGVACAIMAAMLYLSLVMISNEGSREDYQAAIELQLQEYLNQPAQQSVWDFYAAQGMEREKVEAMLMQSMSMVIWLIPGLYAVLFMGFALFCLMLSRILSRWRRLEILTKTAFYQERMPGITVGVLIAALGLMAAGWEQKQGIFYGGVNVLLIVLPAYLYYGLAALSRRLYILTPSYRNTVIALLIFLFIVLPPLVLTGIVLLGLIDSRFSLKYKEKKEEYRS